MDKVINTTIETREYKECLIRAIVRTRIAEKFAELQNDTGEMWYQLGKRHALNNVLLAINMGIAWVIRG